MKRKYKLSLNQKQKDKIWGDDGPYSEARLIFNHRIIDDSVSRIFIEVEVAINPLTFETVLANRDKFEDDEKVQQLLDHADYRGQARGYVISAFCQEYHGKKDLLEANKHLEYAQKTVIKLHLWIMRYFDLKIN